MVYMNNLLVFIIILNSLAFNTPRLTAEKKIYDESISSVFTVFGDSGHGTGFLIDKQNGLIVTNYHVIEQSNHIRVKFNKSLKVEAKVLNKSRYNDMAILQVNPNLVKDVEALKLAPKNYELYIGEKVMAIGSPMSQSEIISSLSLIHI